MDKEAAELSEAGLRLFSKEMSPEYRRVRELLLGYLASREATVELLAKKEVNDRKNVDLLTTFARFLPRAGLVFNKLSNGYQHENWKFITKDPYEVRVIQSNVVWVREDAGTEKHTKSAQRPYYLLGRSQGVKERWLLACAGINDKRKSRKASDSYADIFMFTPSRRSKKELAKLARLASEDYPTPDVMNELFNLETHQLEVSSYSSGSVDVGGKGLRDYYGPTPLVRISDFELATFDVNSNLHRISTALGIEENLSQIISDHTQ